MSTSEIEHPDVTALNAVYAALGNDHGEQTVLDIVNRIFNAGVVFRMAQWWLDENTRALEAHVPPRANQPIKPTNWEAATQQPPAPTAGATGEECE